ncbi:M20/M25/M40 family metallo-hydrolase [Sphingomonas donggukensis]|uniref:Carboxypeptidase Q n=1 Tax=Sphingomonas donggukensis TaxID=2949093 RepID=A0ABY4TXA0_9SPHN|nr:M20/M25/M40 family metallo-hydrolase [Sphingomonas donggukensis]URW77027.1 M20/M25/M40 family metallo-hydrolase [Sphingomonas donggukensis]
MRLPLTLAATSLIAIAMPAAAQQADRTQINRIIDEGTNQSEVVMTAQHLMDVIGPRLTNSPGMRKAEGWTQDKFRTWGLKNIHKEGFDFGRGWQIMSSSVRMVTPRPIQLTAIPIAWTPATNGAISGPVIVAPISAERHFDKWRGQLRGKIVMISLPTQGSEPNEAPFERLSGDDIAKLDQFRQPRYDPEAADRRVKRLDFAKKLDAFLKAEGAIAYATQSYRDGKLVHGEGYMFAVGDTPAIPGVQIAAEDYRRLARLAKMGPAPTLEINSDVRFDDSDTQAYNIFAEIPGTDPKAGYVMAGAHLDSWVAGDGASDNGAGTVMVMEAARILAKMGVRPKRTIRFALWAGEEQGLLGSLDYVEKNLATRGPGGNRQTGLARYMGWSNRWPVTAQPGYENLAAYFNIDNGSGKLRGLYAENNPAVVPIFREWLSPFAGMGAKDVVIGRTGGTDHVFMQAVGIPGYQFIQDPLDYDSRVHHSSIDTFDHMKADDLRQGSIVLAGMLLQSANAEKPLPRMLPQQPKVTDPFNYTDPDEDR